MLKKQLAVIVLGLWLMLIFFFMILIQNVDIEIFFVFGFIGFLVMLKLMEPNYIQPAYMRYFWYIIIVGIIIFCIIAIDKTIKNYYH
jgi:hypothetical protein